MNISELKEKARKIINTNSQHSSDGYFIINEKQRTKITDQIVEDVTRAVCDDIRIVAFLSSDCGQRAIDHIDNILSQLGNRKGGE